ncbi:GNAT family N-acetyltransferase [Pseudoalteromonas sp. SR43-6]|jgi:predicted GNAT family N-acyltransferase|uniref:GNAT family N-acetyltransferase n=1 Tax=Pseudoalteromonas distincta TaxID=77608 RepID=A0A4V1HDM8_9GAMM|nr:MULTISPECIES: GNAT family N-acetyltransferase [Pseudoalteromonas]KAA1158500.1 GNAT family N-acetyltransferase [Pseudoalteromonas distincta]MBB1275609.1 GNAT family N-acetyltransferase [Pseudoalteromonas sp. SR43-3]MBB1290896.1 GNAT family N-acetyltransferase [Pseudoalteromonas sp. SR41-5]MBB1328782.1 GNAT family N-acetyltransferase [Pseudoalteromonas sp. SR43-7]MBB1337720.1 GNAT family N-acetyltransferase [Pseudoalteromonas sp. SR44-2]|tara:strand:+ start:30003 stop:30404 length:402 start_codon:yes stop_codon:yes gene_type:complete
MYKVEVLNELKTPLVNKFYKKHSVRGRANKQDKVWVTYYNNEIVAACRLQDKTEFLFLSTMFVALEHRGKGIAKQLLSTLLKSQNREIKTFAYENVADLYCAIGFNQVLTYTLALQVLFDTYKHRNIVALEYP